MLGDPRIPGKYLCLAWSAWQAPIGEVLSGMYALGTAATVKDGMRAVTTMHFPDLNWAFADAEGSIGYRKQLLRKAFAELPQGPRARWGHRNPLVMENVFFGGKLPRFLGLDQYGVDMPGSLDPPRQGTLYRDAGRATSYCPSNRFVTDLGTQEAWTVIPGGPSEKRFSGLYLTDVEQWQRGEYRLLDLGKPRKPSEGT